jgi:hypothetical protein
MPLDDGLLSITLRVSVTSRTPGKMAMSDLIQSPFDMISVIMPFNSNRTASEEAAAQDLLEIFREYPTHTELYRIVMP